MSNPTYEPNTPLSEPERIRVEAFGLDKPEGMGRARERLAAAQEGRRQRGLHPKGTDQTYEEQTRVLMTWTKAELVRSLILEESDKLKAIDQLIDARAAQVVPQPDREALLEALFYVDDRGRHVFRYADHRATLEDDPYLRDMIPVLATLSPAPLTINREALANVVAQALLGKSLAGAHERVADAVIAHLSAQTVEGEVERPITDEQVEAAAKAVCRAWEGEHLCTNFHVHESHKRVARAALEAARGAQS